MAWSVTSPIVITMRQIDGSIVKNQVYVGKWLIYESIVDTVRVYIYWYGDDMDEGFKVELDQMVEDQDGLGEAIQPRRNL